MVKKEVISSRTQSRKRKVELLRESLNYILDLLQLYHQHREMIHISKYKEINRKLKDMVEKAKPV
jgi:deoxyadenosine/deoxycytidine kinase